MNMARDAPVKDATHPSPSAVRQSMSVHILALSALRSVTESLKRQPRIDKAAEIIRTGKPHRGDERDSYHDVQKTGEELLAIFHEALYGSNTTLVEASLRALPKLVELKKLTCDGVLALLQHWGARLSARAADESRLNNEAIVRGAAAVICQIVLACCREETVDTDTYNKWAPAHISEKNPLIAALRISNRLAEKLVSSALQSLSMREIHEKEWNIVAPFLQCAFCYTSDTERFYEMEVASIQSEGDFRRSSYSAEISGVGGRREVVNLASQPESAKAFSRGYPSHIVISPQQRQTVLCIVQEHLSSAYHLSSRVGWSQLSQSLSLRLFRELLQAHGVLSALFSSYYARAKPVESTIIYQKEREFDTMMMSSKPQPTVNANGDSAEISSLILRYEVMSGLLITTFRGLVRRFEDDVHGNMDDGIGKKRKMWREYAQKMALNLTGSIHETVMNRGFEKSESSSVISILNYLRKLLSIHIPLDSGSSSSASSDKPDSMPCCEERSCSCTRLVAGSSVLLPLLHLSISLHLTLEEKVFIAEMICDEINFVVGRPSNRKSTVKACQGCIDEFGSYIAPLAIFPLLYFQNLQLLQNGVMEQVVAGVTRVVSGQSKKQVSAANCGWTVAAMNGGQPSASIRSLIGFYMNFRANFRTEDSSRQNRSCCSTCDWLQSISSNCPHALSSTLKAKKKSKGGLKNVCPDSYCTTMEPFFLIAFLFIERDCVWSRALMGVHDVTTSYLKKWSETCNQSQSKDAVKFDSDTSLMKNLKHLNVALLPTLLFHLSRPLPDSAALKSKLFYAIPEFSILQESITVFMKATVYPLIAVPSLLPTGIRSLCRMWQLHEGHLQSYLLKVMYNQKKLFEAKQSRMSQLCQEKSIAVALSLYDICMTNPTTALDYVAIINAILSCKRPDFPAVALSLAIDCIAVLCDSGKLDVISVWNTVVGKADNLIAGSNWKDIELRYQPTLASPWHQPITIRALCRLMGTFQLTEKENVGGSSQSEKNLVLKKSFIKLLFSASKLSDEHIRAMAFTSLSGFAKSSPQLFYNTSDVSETSAGQTEQTEEVVTTLLPLPEIQNRGTSEMSSQVRDKIQIFLGHLLRYEKSIPSGAWGTLLEEATEAEGGQSTHTSTTMKSGKTAAAVRAAPEKITGTAAEQLVRMSAHLVKYMQHNRTASLHSGPTIQSGLASAFLCAYRNSLFSSSKFAAMEGDVGANTDNSDTDIMTPTRNRTNRGMAGLVLTYLDDALNDIRIPSQARWMYQPWLMNGFICFMVEAIAGLGDYYDRNQDNATLMAEFPTKAHYFDSLVLAILRKASDESVAVAENAIYAIGALGIAIHGPFPEMARYLVGIVEQLCASETSKYCASPFFDKSTLWIARSSQIRSAACMCIGFFDCFIHADSVLIRRHSELLQAAFSSYDSGDIVGLSSGISLGVLAGSVHLQHESPEAEESTHSSTNSAIFAIVQEREKKKQVVLDIVAFLMKNSIMTADETDEEKSMSSGGWKLFAAVTGAAYASRSLEAIGEYSLIGEIYYKCFEQLREMRGIIAKLSAPVEEMAQPKKKASKALGNNSNDVTWNSRQEYLFAACCLSTVSLHMRLFNSPASTVQLRTDTELLQLVGIGMPLGFPRFLSSENSSEFKRSNNYLLQTSQSTLIQSCALSALGSLLPQHLKSFTRQHRREIALYLLDCAGLSVYLSSQISSVKGKDKGKPLRRNAHVQIGGITGVCEWLRGGGGHLSVPPSDNAAFITSILYFSVHDIPSSSEQPQHDALLQDLGFGYSDIVHALKSSLQQHTSPAVSNHIGWTIRAFLKRKYHGDASKSKSHGKESISQQDITGTSLQLEEFLHAAELHAETFSQISLSFNLVSHLSTSILHLETQKGKKSTTEEVDFLYLSIASLFQALSNVPIKILPSIHWNSVLATISTQLVGGPELSTRNSRGELEFSVIYFCLENISYNWARDYVSSLITSRQRLESVNNATLSTICSSLSHHCVKGRYCDMFWSLTKAIFIQEKLPSLEVQHAFLRGIATAVSVAIGSPDDIKGLSMVHDAISVCFGRLHENHNDKVNLGELEESLYSTLSICVSQLPLPVLQSIMAVPVITSAAECTIPDGDELRCTFKKVFVLRDLIIKEKLHLSALYPWVIWYLQHPELERDLQLTPNYVAHILGSSFAASTLKKGGQAFMDVAQIVADLQDKNQRQSREKGVTTLCYIVEALAGYSGVMAGHTTACSALLCSSDCIDGAHALVHRQAKVVFSSFITHNLLTYLTAAASMFDQICQGSGDAVVLANSISVEISKICSPPVPVWVIANYLAKE